MKREDIMGLGMAYAGCILLTIHLLLLFAYKIYFFSVIIGETCLMLFFIIVIRNKKEFGKAFKKLKLLNFK